MTFFASQMLVASAALAQSHFTGKVVSADDGEPVIGATVRVEGTNVATVTDADGRFVLDLPSNGKSLRVSYVGMNEKTVRVQGNSMTIQLSSDDHSLDEVVVTGYGVTRKAAF